jgi:polysaccharide biosynthesis protein PslH
MKIVNVSYYLPWPLSHGGAQAHFAFLRELSGQHEIVLIVPILHSASNEDVAQLRQALPNVRIDAIRCLPAGCRQRVQAYLHDLVGLVGSGAAFVRGKLRRRPSPAAADMKVSFAAKMLPANYVDALAKMDWSDVDLVLIEYVETITAVFCIPEGVRTAFLNPQVQAVFDRRIVAPPNQYAYADYIRNFNRLMEGECMRRYDRIIVLSEQDRCAIAAEYGISKVDVSPFPVPTNPIAPDACPAPDGKTLAFLGAESHSANKEGLQWFLSNVWPAILARAPSAKLRVIGRWSKEFRSAYSSESSVEFLGFVSDLSDALASAVMVVPIRVGSGVRVKILTAVAQGIPVVSTTVGAEGIPFKDGVSAYIADTADAFVDATIRCLTQPLLARALAQVALADVAPAFSLQSTVSKRVQVLHNIARKNQSAAVETATL